MMDDPLFGWTVYENPKDFPGKFVARKWIARDGRVIATEEIKLGDTLQEVREHLQPLGMVCFQRSPGDDPVIVECWL